MLIPADDIARRNEAERLDWQRRGISGTIAETNPEQIVVEIRTPKGAIRKTITVTSKTVIRRYAPDSVKFTEATPSTIEEIRKGDQVKLRGDPIAEDIVFGTFESHVGTVIAVDARPAISGSRTWHRSNRSPSICPPTRGCARCPTCAKCLPPC